MALLTKQQTSNSAFSYQTQESTTQEEKPFKVIMIMVTSIDGVIAKGHTEMVDWSSKEDKKHFVELTKKIGCLVMGSNSFDTFKKPWTDRTQIVLTREPETYKEKFKEYSNIHFLKTDNPHEIIDLAKELGFSEIALTGGSMVNTFFANANLIDEIYLTIEPKIFGKGINLFNEDLSLQLELIKIDNLNVDSILLHYKVKKN